MDTVKTGDRELHLDSIRILAMLLVIFNHTGNYGYFRFAQTSNPVLYWLYLACSILCAMGVPLFFMVSGALLLRKEESVGTLYRKRVLRILTVLLLFSFLQYLFQTMLRDDAFSLLQFFARLYMGQIVPAYWFLYAYLAYLIMLPFIRYIAAGMRDCDYRYLVIVYALFTAVLPIVQYLAFRRVFSINLSLPLITATAIFFSLIGDGCERLAPDAPAGKSCIVMALMSVACVVVCALMTHYQANVTGELSEETSQTFIACLSFVPAITTFLLAKRLFSQWRCPRAAARAIRSLGSCAFGVYLFHPIFMDRLMPLLYYLQDRISTFPACIVYVLAVYLCGYAVTWLLKRIPPVNKLL